MSVRFICSKAWLKSNISFLFYCFSIYPLLTMRNWISLLLLHYCLSLSLEPLVFLHIFHYSDVAYIYMYDYYIFLTFLSLVTIFGLKSILNKYQFSHSVMSDSLQPRGPQHTRLSCPLSTPGACSNSYPSSQWCHPTISSSVIPFSSCLQFFPASESFPVSQLFPWGAQSTGVSALTSFLPKKSQGWSPSEWTGWISLQPKGASRVFSNTTVQKHQFFGTQLSL